MKAIMQVFAYILGKSSTTDRIKCEVPERIDNESIFFGPCKRDLRRKLREDFLKDKDTADVSTLNIYIIGFNASNQERERKIVWIGKINRIMTFESAWKIFDNEEQTLKSLHLEPKYSNGQFIGYKHVRELHGENNDWIWDIMNKRKSNKAKSRYLLEDSELILKDPKDRQLFEGDCCFLCDNLFFAGNGVDGIEITNNVLDALKRAQPSKEIGKYRIFGSSSRITLHVTDPEIAEQLINEYISKK